MHAAACAYSPLVLTGRTFVWQQHLLLFGHTEEPATGSLCAANCVNQPFLGFMATYTCVSAHVKDTADKLGLLLLPFSAQSSTPSRSPACLALPGKQCHPTCSAEPSTDGALQVKTIAEELGLAFLTCGFDPKWKYEEVPIMPKYRYK